MTEARDRHIEQDFRDLFADGARELEPLRDSTILVTGGTGFLGTWLAELIAFANDHFAFNTRIVLLSSRAGTFRDRVPHLAGRGDVTAIERDIRHLVDIPEDVAWIVHAACSPDSRLHASDPLRTIDVIVNGTATLLATAARLPALRNVVNVSSGWVYGHAASCEEGLSERSWGALDPAAMASVYAEAKRCAEALCAAYRSGHRLPIVTVRPFAYLGPYQLLDKPWAVNNFLRDALRGGPIRILGDPGTVRSYLYASDMAYWTLRGLVAGKSGQAFNIGSPHGVTLHDLARAIAAQCPRPVEIALPTLPKDALAGARFVPDVRAAQSALGVRVTVDLDTAIGRTLRWHQEAGKDSS